MATFLWRGKGEGRIRVPGRPAVVSGGRVIPGALARSERFVDGQLVTNDAETIRAARLACIQSNGRITEQVNAPPPIRLLTRLESVLGKMFGVPACPASDFIHMDAFGG